MVYYIVGVLAVLAVWFFVLRTYPIINEKEQNHNATNTLFFITYDPDLQYPAAIIAQEVFEFRFKWWHLIIFYFFRRRSMELMSHSIECAAAEILYGVDVNAYMVAEAATMLGYDWLNDLVDRDGIYLSGRRIVPELEKRLPKARKWVENNRKLLEKYL